MNHPVLKPFATRLSRSSQPPSQGKRQSHKVIPGALCALCALYKVLHGPASVKIHHAEPGGIAASTKTGDCQEFSAVGPMKESSDPLRDGDTPDAAALPSSVTADDVRAVAHYLKKRPVGVTLGEAVEAVKKQTFEPAKLDAYETLGLVSKAQNRLKLDTLGWELARSLEPEARVFRFMLAHVGPYRAALDWAAGRGLDYLIQTDVAEYWLEHWPTALGLSTPKTVEGNVVCFFHLCQAAGLGMHIIGKRGRPTRLRLDRDGLLDFVNTDWGSEWKDMSGRLPGAAGVGVKAVLRTPEQGQARASSHRPHRLTVFVSSGESEPAARIRDTLDLADIDCRVVERGKSDDSLLRAGAVMRECEAAVIVITAGDFKQVAGEEGRLRERLKLEIGIANVFYEGRVVLLRDERVEVPGTLAGLHLFKFPEGGLTWDVCIQVLRLVKTFGGNWQAGGG